MLNPCQQPNPRTIYLKRVKQIELKNRTELVNLCLLIKAITSSQMDVCVELYPTDEQKKLPEELQLIVLNDQGKSVMQAFAQKSQSLEFQFGGFPGEAFSIKVVLGNNYVTQKLLI